MWTKFSNGLFAWRTKKKAKRHSQSLTKGGASGPTVTIDDNFSRNYSRKDTQTVEVNAERKITSTTLETDRIKPGEVPINLSSNMGNSFGWATILGGEKR